MAVFGRQKRQSRFYWAELGFMALGLLGLQPSLFTSLFTGFKAKSASYADQNYPSTQPQSLDFYRDWAAFQLASLMTQPHSGPISTPNGWAPAPVNGSQVLSSAYVQPGYAAPHYSSTPSYGSSAPSYGSSAPSYGSSAPSYGTPQYAAQNYPAQNYVPNQTNPVQFNGPASSYPQNLAQPNYAPQQQPYAQSAYSQMQPSSNGAYSPTFSTAANPNNQSAHMAQSTTANPYGYPNQATSANGYGASSNGSQPQYLPNSSYSTGYGVPTANNANPYGNGLRAGTYSNPQSNTGVSSGTWQRYQAPTSSTYYR